MDRDEFVSELIELVKKKLTIVGTFSETTISDTKNGHGICELEADQVVYAIKTLVWTETLVDDDITVDFNLPRNWWEHLKKSLGLRHEVATVQKIVNVRQWLTYPDARIVSRSNTAMFRHLGDPIVHEDSGVYE